MEDKVYDKDTKDKPDYVDNTRNPDYHWLIHELNDILKKGIPHG